MLRTIAVAALMLVALPAAIGRAQAQDACTPVKSSCTQMFQRCEKLCQSNNNPGRCVGACQSPLSQCRSTGIWKSPIAPTCWKTGNRA